MLKCPLHDDEANSSFRVGMERFTHAKLLVECGFVGAGVTPDFVVALLPRPVDDMGE